MTKDRRNKRNKGTAFKQLKKLEGKLKPSDVMQRFREQARQIYMEAKKSGKIGTVQEEARRLASEAKESDSSISSIYWFPHDEEVHLIMIDSNLVPSGAGHVEPFYFDSTATDPVPSGIAIIGPEEYRNLRMPRGWGDWDDGQEIKLETGSTT
jgi:hypothetical protein